MSESEKKEPEKEAPKDEGKKSDAANNLTNDVANLKVNEAEQRPGSTSPAPASGSFIASFKAFSKFGDTKSDGKHITLSQSDKWMKQAKVIDGKKITTTDTGIFFKKQKYASSTNFFGFSFSFLYLIIFPRGRLGDRTGSTRFYDPPPPFFCFCF